MPLYEFECPECGDRFEVRRSFSEAENPLMCAACETPANRVYSFSYSMPGKSDADSWNDWYDGKEAAVGMTRERTQQLARHAYNQTKGNRNRVSGKKTVSTPSHPAVRVDDRTG